MGKLEEWRESVTPLSAPLGEGGVRRLAWIHDRLKEGMGGYFLGRLATICIKAALLGGVYSLWLYLSGPDVQVGLLEVGIGAYFALESFSLLLDVVLWNRALDEAERLENSEMLKWRQRLQSPPGRKEEGSKEGERG